MVHSIFPRAISNQVSRPFIRSFADVVAVNQPIRRRKLKRSDIPLLSTPVLSISGTLIQKVPAREDHGLYAFFRRKSDDTLEGEDRFEVVESPESYQLSTGRAWFASELRHKSFKDLHTLWYVCLRERNLLATQKEEVRRMGVTNSELLVSSEKVRNCRKTMARIKAVLNERRLAYLGAVELAEKERNAINDKATQ